jgi:hypothetical protein
MEGKMKTRIIFMLVIALIFLTPCFAQEPTAEQMEMIEKLGQPGEFHELLKNFVGTWSAEVTMWMNPGSPPVLSKGKATFEQIFEGRYIVGDYLGEFMGAPFKGKSIIGYDNAQKKFFSFWIDNYSTGNLMSAGKYDPEKKKFHFLASMFDPLSGQDMEMREEAYFASKDVYISTTYAKPKGGEEFKNMEIKYTRVK